MPNKHITRKMIKNRTSEEPKNDSIFPTKKDNPEYKKVVVKDKNGISRIVYKLKKWLK